MTSVQGPNDLHYPHLRERVKPKLPSRMEKGNLEWRKPSGLIPMITSSSASVMHHVSVRLD